MSMTPSWEAVSSVTPPPIVSAAAAAVIERAGRLAAEEIERLDRAERVAADARLIAWDLLRDAVDRDADSQTLRLVVGRLAWEAVTRSAVAAGLLAVEDHGYWRVTRQPGAGAARLARFAACAVLVPADFDPDAARLLTESWLPRDTAASEATK